MRVVQVEYAQAWLAGALESTGQKQAAWRTDPAQSGPGGAIGDIGSHAFHLACFVTDRVPEQVLGDLSTFVPGRRVDDNAHVLLRFADGARGMLWASQVAHGHENALRLRVYGAMGGLEWAQEEPDRLWFTPSDRPRRLLTRGGVGMETEAARIARLPAGHPEGYLEGFATIYAEVARAVIAARDGATIGPGGDVSVGHRWHARRSLHRGMCAIFEPRVDVGSICDCRVTQRPPCGTGPPSEP